MLVCLLISCGKAETPNADDLNNEAVGTQTETQENTERVEETEVISTEVAESEQPEVPKSEVVESEQPALAPAPAPQPAAPEMESWASGYYVYDPHNTRGLSNAKTPHAYGTAPNEQRPAYSITNQRTFDNMNGMKILTLDLKSTEKVLYLTFSCGYEYNNNTVKILDILKEKDVKAAFFGELGYFKNNPHLTQRFIAEGHILGNHTATHPDFTALSRNEMASQVYRVDKFLKDQYGYDCRYFRFPGGYYSENSLELVASLGHRMIFWSVAYADWDRNEIRGADYSFDIVTGRLHPGAVIVLHAVSNDNVEALGRIIDYAREKGYIFKSLDEYPWGE